MKLEGARAVITSSGVHYRELYLNNEILTRYFGLFQRIMDGPRMPCKGLVLHLTSSRNAQPVWGV